MPVLCETCGKSFAVKRYLKNHIRKVHTSARVPCTVCKKLLATKTTMLAHRRIKHPESGRKGRSEADKVECNVCKKKFVTPTTLKAHRKFKHPEEVSQEEAEKAKIAEEEANKMTEDKVESADNQADEDNKVTTTIITSEDQEQQLKHGEENQVLTSQIQTIQISEGGEFISAHLPEGSQVQTIQLTEGSQFILTQLAEGGQILATQIQEVTEVVDSAQLPEGSQVLTAAQFQEVAQSQVAAATEQLQQQQQQLPSDGRIVCRVCSKSFAFQSSLTTHLREIHQIFPHRRDSCHCPQCGEPCFTTKAVIEHLASEHYINVVQQEVDFETFNEFLDWKANIEKETVSFYLYERKVVNQSTIVHYYPCNRSGYHIAKEKKGTKKRTTKESIKINAICPASMTAFEKRSNGHVMVKYIKTHIGHRNDPSKLPISQADRELIKEKYRNNVPLKVIIEEFRQLPKTLPLKYISRANIQRIGKSLKQSQNQPPPPQPLPPQPQPPQTTSS